VAISVVGFLRVGCEEESIFVFRHWDNVERHEKCQNISTTHYASEMFYVFVLTKYRNCQFELKVFLGGGGMNK
jgi:hypothetical protein